MARERELGGVGECGGNEEVKAGRDQAAKRAIKEARKKVLNK